MCECINLSLAAPRQHSPKDEWLKCVYRHIAKSNFHLHCALILTQTLRWWWRWSNISGSRVVQSVEKEVYNIVYLSLSLSRGAMSSMWCINLKCGTQECKWATPIWCKRRLVAYCADGIKSFSGEAGAMVKNCFWFIGKMDSGKLAFFLS